MSRLGFRLRSLLATLAVLGVVLAALSSSTEVRWRLGVIALKSTGKLPDLGWNDLLPMLKPGSGFWLAPMVTSPNPYAVIRGPFDTDSGVRTGRVLFRWRCEQCHGPGGSGASAPALFGRDLAHGSSDWALFQTIRYGVPSTAMAPHDFPQDDIWKLVAYIHNLAAQHDSSLPKDLADASPLDVQFQDLRATSSAGADWPTYYGSYNGQRFSNLSDINRSNIGQLAARWIHPLQANGGRIQATPIVSQGRMFLTTPEGGVIALDARTGVQLWRYSRSLDGDVSLCCVTANRGVAVLKGTVYVTTLDAHLIALDGATGAVLWNKVIADFRVGYSSTGAPLVVKGMVITGVAGSEYAAPGFVTAFDANTGNVLWRFDTIPRPGHKGNETWAGDSWRHGGVSAWMTGTYDADLDLIYWGTGNAAPDFDATARAGDNLYSDSVVALHADSGTLAWYFQYSPNDDHDWDAVQTPVLADIPDGSRTRKLLLSANRNGFCYALDRTTGKFLWAKAFVKQTWATRIDENGRPVRRPEASASSRGSLVYPGSSGGTNWWPPTFSPRANLLIVPALERPSIFFRTGGGERRDGEKSLGGSSSGAGEGHYTAVRALDASSGDLRWEFRSISADMSGLLSTAGDLVFASDESRLVALDIADGRQLWAFEAGAHVYAPPIAYRAGGEQFIAFTAGDVMIGAALAPGLGATGLIRKVNNRTAKKGLPQHE